MINNIEKVESNLKNQTISFDYIDGKYVKYGVFSKIENSSYYGISSIDNNYATYISYDPNTSIGFIVNIKYDSKSRKNSSYSTFKSLSDFFYSHSLIE